MVKTTKIDMLSIAELRDFLNERGMSAKRYSRMGLKTLQEEVNSILNKEKKTGKRVCIDDPKPEKKKAQLPVSLPPQL